MRVVGGNRNAFRVPFRGPYPDGLDRLLGVVVDGDVDGDLLPVVVGLVVESALKDDLRRL